jgi:hypothetical protein
LNARLLLAAGAILVAIGAAAGCGSCGDRDKDRNEGTLPDGGFGVSWDGGGRHRRMHGGRGRFGNAEAPEAGGNPVDAGARPD